MNSPRARHPELFGRFVGAPYRPPEPQETLRSNSDVPTGADRSTRPTLEYPARPFRARRRRAHTDPWVPAAPTGTTAKPH